MNTVKVTPVARLGCPPPTGRHLAYTRSVWRRPDHVCIGKDGPRAVINAGGFFNLLVMMLMGITVLVMKTDLKL